MKIDAKIITAIRDMETIELFDVLDMIGRSPSPDSTHDELVHDVLTLYERGIVTSEDVLAAYNGGL